MTEPKQPTPLWMQRWFQITLGSLLLLAVASLALPWLLGLIYALRSVLLPLVIALGLAYIFNPLVSWMHHRLKLPRWAGTACVMLGAGWLALVLALLILPPLISQGVELIDRAKRYPEQISRLIQHQAEKQPPSDTAAATGAVVEPESTDSADTSSSTPAEAVPADGTGRLDQLQQLVEDALGPEQAAAVLAAVADWLSKLDWQQVAGVVLASLDIGVGVVGSAISLTSYVALTAVIVLFCFFFFSWKLDRLIEWFVPFIPASHKSEVLGVVVMMDKSVAAFIRGRLVQAMVMSFVLSVGWWLSGVPSWLLLGVLSGVLNLVPFAAVVGYAAALVLVLVDSFAGGGLSWSAVIWPTVVYLLAQGLDGWVVEPIVQGKATDLDPVSVLVSVMIGGALAGLLGLLIAIPVAACIKILSHEVILPRLRQMAAGDMAASDG